MKHNLYKRGIQAGIVACFCVCLCVSTYVYKAVNLANQFRQSETGEAIIVKNIVPESTLLKVVFEEDEVEEEHEEILLETLQAAESIGTRYVAGSVVNLRQQPSKDSEVLKRLSRNTQVELLVEREDDFSCVRLDGVVGYMHNDFLSETEVEVPEVTGSYDHVDSVQERVAEIARNNLGTMPCTADYCAKWVSGVYQAAGIGYPGGDAIDWWLRWGSSGSTDINNIPVGAAVVGSGNGSEAGNAYGHVGIYIGNGLVADNVGRHRIISIWEWANFNVGYCRGYHGYIGWVWPYGTPLN